MKEGSYMRRSLTAAVLVVVLAASTAYGQGPNLVGGMEARKIVLDEDNREIAVSADQVFPLDTIEYTLTYHNAGNASAAGINLIGPIPQGTIYLEETATEIENVHPLFSIDGGRTFQEAPVIYTVVNDEGEKEVREATPDMITHVQWSMDESLEVGHEVIVSYRVQVK
jgi:uncharacterized repeat protein (TIGR01451 family)